MEKYEYLEHTADAKFRAYGKNLEEQFSNGAEAMFNVIVDTQEVKNTISKNIKVNGKDEKSLLFNFLDELLFLFHTDFFVFKRVKKIKIKNNELEAEVVGDESKNYEYRTDIKAITYNEMEITKNYIQAVVDV